MWSTNAGWFWDEVEDLGGDDRITPSGPFEDDQMTFHQSIASCVIIKIMTKVANNPGKQREQEYGTTLCFFSPHPWPASV